MNDETLKLAQKALKLKDIYVRETNSNLSESFFPSLSGDENEIRFQTRIGTQRHVAFEAKVNEKEAAGQVPSRFVDYRVLVGARFLDSSVSDEDMENEDLPTDKVLGEITALYSVLYELVSEINEEALIEFGNRNAPFHLWPFWREFLQSSSGKMHLPPVVLPLFMPPSSGTENRNVESNDSRSEEPLSNE